MYSWLYGSECEGKSYVLLKEDLDMCMNHVQYVGVVFMYNSICVTSFPTDIQVSKVTG